MRTSRTLRGRSEARRSATAKRRSVDWARWRPRDHATLLFVIAGRRVLLIRKKRGLGAGKINGPGGRIEADETPRRCALREVREELRVTPRRVRYAGRLCFQFTDGYAIRAEVFTARGCAGTPTETPEAVPLWTALDRLPFDRMWADDRHWMPLMFAGKRFSGRFVFDGDRMLWHSVRAAAVREPDRRCKLS